MMNQDKIKQLAVELAKDLKTPEDLSKFSAALTKITVEPALNAELESHLGYAPHDIKAHNSGNNRNGHTPKTIKGDHDEITINAQR